MATTTILQYLQHKGVSASGASVEYGTSPLDRIQTETFMCETAITAGQLVAVDVSKMASDPTGGFTALTVVASDFNSAPVQKIAVGFAQSSVTGTTANPQPITVVVRGPCQASLLVTVGCALGDALVLDTSGATPGGLMVATGATFTHVVGYALNAPAAAGPVKIYVLGCGI